MTPLTFKEFPEVSKTDWINQAMKDLKGKTIDESLVFNTFENIRINPYYASDDLENIPLNAFDLAQTDAQKTWLIRQLVCLSDIPNTNKMMIELLHSGVNELILDLSDKPISELDLVKLLNQVKLSDFPLFFKTSEAIPLINKLKSFVHYQAKGGIYHDFLLHALTNPSANQSSWHASLPELFQSIADYPQFNAFLIDVKYFHDKGATAVQELAIALAEAVEYIDKLTDEGLSIETILSKMEFSFSVGTNYFMEIAKFRAFKFLWSKLADVYDNQAFVSSPKINAQTSYFYTAAPSPYTNMIRSTTEAMSAVIGGCHSLTVLPYDEALLEEKSGFSDRIAKNVALLLKEEGYFDKVKDPAAGSYYLENLSFNLAQDAYQLFLEIEAQGGFSQSFLSGNITQRIQNSLDLKREALLSNTTVMVGVNKFQENQEKKAASKDSNRLSSVFE